ncbi:hypothetical protein M3J09_005554 [Ascochyta lentis]
MAWSIEAIIALITLLATCVTLGVLLWRLHKRTHRQPGKSDVEDGVELLKYQHNVPRADSFVIVQAMVHIR